MRNLVGGISLILISLLGFGLEQFVLAPNQPLPPSWTLGEILIGTILFILGVWTTLREKRYVIGVVYIIVAVTVIALTHLVSIANQTNSFILYN